MWKVTENCRGDHQGLEKYMIWLSSVALSESPRLVSYSGIWERTGFEATHLCTGTSIFCSYTANDHKDPRRLYMIGLRTSTASIDIAKRQQK